MLVQQLVNGFTLGMMYALLALGYSLIFGVLSFINFAHGDVAVFSAYSFWWLYTIKSIPFLPAILLALLIGALLGIVIERLGYKPIRKAPRLSAVIVSMGFSFILSVLIQIIWGTNPHQVSSVGKIKTWNFGSFLINSLQLWILGLAIIIMILLQLLLKKTRIGLAMRAIALDRNTSMLMGVNVDTTVSVVFAVGSITGAISAIMMAIYYGALYTVMGANIGMKGFAAVVLGGAGSMPGAVIGGLLLGLIESLAGTFLNTQLRDAISAVIVILMLVIKPAGLLGKDVIKE